MGFTHDDVIQTRVSGKVRWDLCSLPEFHDTSGVRATRVLQFPFLFAPHKQLRNVLLLSFYFVFVVLAFNSMHVT